MSSVEGPVLVLGGGSNVVVADSGFDGTVVEVATSGVRADVEGDDPTCGGALVTVAAGESWKTSSPGPWSASGWASRRWPAFPGRSAPPRSRTSVPTDRRSHRQSRRCGSGTACSTVCAPSRTPTATSATAPRGSRPTPSGTSYSTSRSSSARAPSHPRSSKKPSWRSASSPPRKRTSGRRRIPKGTKLAMLMLEDPKAIEQRKEIADLPGHQHSRVRHRQPGAGDRRRSRCGAGAEAGTQQVLVETKRVKIANMLTANATDVETARQGRLPRAVDAGRAGRRSDQDRPRRGRTMIR